MSTDNPTTAVSVIEEMLNPFTARESVRYGIDRQWVKNGWRNATDSAIAVRVRTDEPDWQHTAPNGRHKSVPKMESIFDPLMNLDGFLGVFQDVVPIPDCDVCKNTGRVTLQCECCLGLGHRECRECGHEGECLECDGSGHTEEDCVKHSHVVVSDGELITSHYWFLIQRLPIVTIRHMDIKSLFKFTVGGLAGQGIVMHRKQEE